MARAQTFTITGTSPATATTAAIGSVINGLLQFNHFNIHANVQGATGGTLNLRLQRQIADDVWSDWLSLPQLGAAAAAISYAASLASATTIAVVGGGSLASPTVVLAANTFVGGHPGDRLRLIGTGGASTSAGATQTIYIQGIRIV